MLSGLVFTLSATGAIAEVSPLPPSNYSMRSACSTPAPGSASCLAVQLVPISAAARAHTRPLGMTSAHPLRPSAAAAEGAYGLRPQDFHNAYGLPTTTEVPQTIAVVDAYDDPNAEHDLAVYDREFGLPECTTSNGCFAKINQSGTSSPLPAANGEWSMEIALDVETAHAICQNCRILLVEAESNGLGALEAAENRAALEGATEITNSWGANEPLNDSAAFNHPGVVITAAAGDNGYLNWDAYSARERGTVVYPAASPHVVAVGSTRLELNGSERTGESVWNNSDGASGGGCSTSFAAPVWQRALSNWAAVGCGTGRAVADVSADGDPYTGAAVYDSTPWDGYVLGWLPVGGTSLSSPLIAGAYALAGGAHGQPYAGQALYENERSTPGSLHEIAGGSNGECLAASSASGESGCSAGEEAASCGGRAICTAGGGYSGAAGVGTPDGLGAFIPRGESFPAITEAGAAQNGTDAGGGSGAAAASEAGTQRPPASGQAPSNSVHRRVRLSSLSLTPRALAALRRHHTSTTTMSFSFSLSAPSPVRVTLNRLTTAGARKATATRARTHVLTSSFELAARRGRNQWRMRGAGTIVPGRYRLTVAPAAGASRSLVIVVR